MSVRVLLLAVLTWLLVAVPGRAHYVDLSQALVQKGSLTVGLALAGRPFSYQQDGALQGFEPALAAAVASAHGLEPRIVRLPRDELLAALSDGRVDVIATTMLSPEAPGMMIRPYLVLGDHMMVLRGNPFRIVGLEDLPGRVVAVQSGSSAEVFARDVDRRLRDAGVEGMHIHSFPFQRDVHFPVSMGHAAAYFVQSRTAVAASLDPEGRNRLVPGAFRATQEVGLAVRPGNDTLDHAVEHAIAALVATGKYDRLLDRHDIPADLSAFSRDD